MEEDKAGRDISAGSELLKGAVHATVTITWQQERVIKHLREMYPDGRLLRPKWLLARLAKRDPKLKSLDWKTLRRAMDAIRRATISGNET
jgi:hypothetical protein